MATYSDFSDICTRFYDLVVKPKDVADFVLSKLGDHKPFNALFVGGFFLVAKEIYQKGIELKVVDYTDEMVEEARKRLPEIPVEKASLEALSFDNEFDCIFVIGRVFTHMLSVEDSENAVKGLYKSLKEGGVLFFDNYEDSKIRVTDYFNGRIDVADESMKIIRDSSTSLVSESPYLVNWKAEYKILENGVEQTYQDEMLHRAFSRTEVKDLLEKNGFKVEDQGDNFDDTSFYTLAIKL